MKYVYYLFCNSEEESILNDEGLYFLKNKECNFQPLFKKYLLGDEQALVDAVYDASTYGGYYLLSKKEYYDLKD